MRIITLCLLLFGTLISYGQPKKIKTEIKSKNVFDLSIIRIYPESYPEVSVVFQAKNESGKPLWTLDKSEIKVKENRKNCDITKLVNISKNKSVNVGLIFDHSGSMIDNPMQMPMGIESMQRWYLMGLPLPRGYIMPIEYAKEGVIEFISETNGLNDSILFVGFSSMVDAVYPLTNQMSDIKLFIDEVEPGGATAFYDALVVGVDSLSNSTGECVIVAITDGQDNVSTHTDQDVINLAMEKNIAIYTIGLGVVDTLVLERIAKRTGGLTYLTNDPSKLKEIYLNIKEQIRSVYQITYKSNGLDYLNRKREIQFIFENDTLQFSNDTAIYSLPDEAVAYLKKKEAARRNYLMLGIGIVVIGIGAFLVYRKRRKS